MWNAGDDKRRVDTLALKTTAEPRGRLPGPVDDSNRSCSKDTGPPAYANSSPLIRPFPLENWSVSIPMRWSIET